MQKFDNEMRWGVSEWDDGSVWSKKETASELAVTDRKEILEKSFDTIDEIYRQNYSHLQLPVKPSSCHEE